MLYVSSQSRLRLRAENFRGEKGYIYAVDIPLAGENIVTIIGGLPTVMVMTNTRVKQGNVNVETPTYNIVGGCGAYLGGGKWLYGRTLADNSWKLYLWNGTTLTDLSPGISSTPYAIAFYNGLAYIGQKDGYFHKYDPNANTFTGINLGLTTGDHISSICGDDLFIYIGTVTGKLKRYDPATGTVDDLTTYINAAKINQLIHNPYNNTIIAILNDGLVVKDSSNRGIVWTPRTANLPLNFPPITSATVDPSTGRITMGNSRGELIEISPSWLHCTPLTDNFMLPQEPVKCLLVISGRLYADTWISKTPLPPTDGRSDSSSCLIKGKLYYFGGWKTGGGIGNNTYEYDPRTDTWVEKTPMPTARWGIISVACNYKAYVFGGAIPTTYTNILEVFDPFALSSVWNSGVIATGTSADTAGNIIIDGNYLYAVSNSPQKLVIYDISNPSSPVQKALVSLGRGAVDIRKKDNYLLISTLGATDGGVDIYDVSNPASPQYVTRVNLGGHTHGMFLLGDYLYVCMHYNDTFVIIDVSNPVSPVVKGSITSSTYLHGCYDVWVEAGYAYVTSYLAASGQYGFTVIDVSNPSSPTIVGYTGENHKNSAIFKVGNYCYVGSHSPDTGMRVYDVSNPSSPTFIGQFYTDVTNLGYWMDDYDSTTLVAISPSYLHLIDISSPTSPKIITNISTVENPKNIAVTGDYFYVSTEDSSYNWRIRSFTRTTQWVTKSPMPYSLQGLMAIYLPYDGKIHLFGGRDNSANYTNLHFTYDPATDTYNTTTPAAMPHGRNWATCALINNLIYIIAGYKHNYNDRYDPATNTWTTLAPLPVSSLYGATRENPVINGIIYVTHGQDPPSPTYYATVYAYDPSTNTWTQKTTGMNPRDGVACGVTNEILLVIGGRYESTAYRYSEAYFP